MTEFFGVACTMTHVRFRDVGTLYYLSFMCSNIVNQRIHVFWVSATYSCLIVAYMVRSSERD